MPRSPSGRHGMHAHAACPVAQWQAGPFFYTGHSKFKKPTLHLVKFLLMLISAHIAGSISCCTMATRPPPPLASRPPPSALPGQLRQLQH